MTTDLQILKFLYKKKGKKAGASELVDFLREEYELNVNPSFVNTIARCMEKRGWVEFTEPQDILKLSKEGRKYLLAHKEEFKSF